MSFPFNSPNIDLAVSAIAALADLSAVRAGRLDATLSSRAAIADLTAARAARLDAAVSSRALLSVLTAARAGIIDTLDPTAKVGFLMPALADAVAVTTGVGGHTFGAWAQVVAAAPAACAIVGFFIPSTHPNSLVYLQIGVGAAGSEVVIGEFALGYGATAPVGIPTMPIEPPVVVANGVRVAVRVADQASGATAMKCGLVAVPTPF